MSVTDQDQRPLHPIAQMTTSELAGYRRNLEHALGQQTLPPSWAPREELQKRLDAVLAEVEERDRIRHANT